jgi:hypothetical protein
VTKRLRRARSFSSIPINSSPGPNIQPPETHVWTAEIREGRGASSIAVFPRTRLPLFYTNAQTDQSCGFSKFVTPFPDDRILMQEIWQRFLHKLSDPAPSDHSATGTGKPIPIHQEDGSSDLSVLPWLALRGSWQAVLSRVCKP